MCVVVKSEKCIQNEHGLCEGDVVEVIYDSKTTKICECQCHNNMYRLIRRMQAANSSNNSYN
jgi:DNA-directed RNA polymerase subunit H (RpoH/RPB5)